MRLQCRANNVWRAAPLVAVGCKVIRSTESATENFVINEECFRQQMRESGSRWEEEDEEDEDEDEEKAVHLPARGNK